MPMRRLTLTASPQDGSFYPADKIHKESDINRELLLHVNLLSDGTITALYRMKGNIDKLRNYYDELPEILEYDVFAVDGESYHVYVHVDEGQPATGLLEIVEQNNLIIDTPVEFNDDGSVRLAVSGEAETLRNMMEAIPDNIEVEIEKMGDYKPEESRLESNLTERQKEVLEVAVENGYYQVPRKVNSEDLSQKLGCTPSTVSEHLRKIEANVLSSLIE